MQDTSWFGQKVVEKLASFTARRHPAQAGPAVADLTPRAREVVALIAQGLDDAEVAKKLGVSRNTLKNHVSAIYKATGAQRRTALVIWAREHGLGAPAKPQPKQRRNRA